MGVGGGGGGGGGGCVLSMQYLGGTGCPFPSIISCLGGCGHVQSSMGGLFLCHDRWAARCWLGACVSIVVTGDVCTMCFMMQKEGESGEGGKI